MPDTSNPAPDLAEEKAAAQLRRALITKLQDDGWVDDARIGQALTAVPRHLFVPETDVETAYTNATVSVKDDVSGTSLSCASVPTIVAMMLGQADLAPGQRVLEIGAGTGYNAALLWHLVAPKGQVTSLDVDPDLVARARTHLEHADYGQVHVACADGADGHPAKAPFDRIMATVGVFDVPPAWLDQLTPAGRLVVPVRLAGDASRAIAFTRAGDYWRGVDAQMCTFMPLRHSTAADARTTLPLTSDESVTLQVNQDQRIRTETVREIFTEQRSGLWTGVTFGGYESFGELWLWLALVLENSLSRMPVTRAAIDSGLVEPMLGWGSMATTARPPGRGLAYLTLRPVGDRNELGVIGHGPHGHALAERMASEITRWNEYYRTREVAIDLYPHPHTPPPPAPGRFILPRHSAHLAVTWREEPAQRPDQDPA